MKLPDHSIIAVTTLYDELLQPTISENQATYLAHGGYTRKNWIQLERDLRELLSQEATRVKSDDMGDYFEINGNLGDLPVKTLWFWEKAADAPRFVTLLPFL